MTALIEALKKKYRTPQEALKALGLDEALLVAEPRKDPPMATTMDISKVLRRPGAVTSLKALLAFDTDPDHISTLLQGLERKDADDLAALDPSSGYPAGGEEEEEEAVDWEARADDARRKLGRDETEEEREEREKEQAAGDARRKLGRDETEGEREEREEVEGDARRARDAARRADDRRRALDAKRRLGRDETEEEREAREAKDRKRAADRRADDARRRADDRARRADDARRGRVDDEPPPFPGRPNVGGGTEGGMDKKAMDAAIATAVTNGIKGERANQEQVRAALTLVRPLVGELNMAFDGPNDVFRQVLTMRGRKVEGLHPDAYRPIVETLLETKPRERTETPSYAEDAAFTGGGNIPSITDIFTGARTVRN